MVYFTFQGMHTLLGGNYRYALTAIVCAWWGATQCKVTTQSLSSTGDIHRKVTE